jgi:hypothetical protein
MSITRTGLLGMSFSVESATPARRAARGRDEAACHRVSGDKTSN